MMSWKKTIFLCSTILMNCGILFCQKNVTTVGLQFKPIIPYGLLNTGKETIEKNQVSLTIDPNTGFSFGMVIRKGISKLFSIESGINYVARNYNLRLNDRLNDKSVSTDMRFSGYEIPVLGLVFIQLGEKLYINSAFGTSFDFYPTGGIVTIQDGYEFGIVESSWVQSSLLANVGFEYRTKKKGYWYLGGSFHRPFSTTAVFELNEITNFNTFERILDSKLSGNYLTLDLRYFFSEKPSRKK